MLSKSDEEVLDDRLRNWGRWSAVTPSSDSNILYRKMVSVGTIKLEPSNGVVPIDHSDALLVNRAWQSLPEEPLRYFIAKRILVLHFCKPGITLEVACRKLRVVYKGQEINRVTLKEYGRLLNLAKYMIFNRITYQASKHLVQHTQDVYHPERK